MSKKADINRIKYAAEQGIFADDIDRNLPESGLMQLITTNSIPDKANQADSVKLLVTSWREFYKSGE